MNKVEIKKILDTLETNRERNLVIIDFGNVDKWDKSLGWKIGIRELKNFIKHFTYGEKFLRRFYYGSDYGKNEKNQIMIMCSARAIISEKS